GNKEIYTVPAEGGEPVRITYSMDIGDMSERMGPDKIIMQWSADGNKILYRGRQDQWNSLCGNLFLVSKDGGLPEELPLPRGGFAYLSPDGTKLAYNRIFREFRTWKRYRGGQADDIWIYDFKTKKVDNITNNEAQDIIPLWFKDKVYFLSDRDHTMNLFCYDMNSKQTKKVTDFKEFDVKFPSLGGDNIVFENGGYIYILDCNTDQSKKVNIELGEDLVTARPKFVDVKKSVTNFEISPDGKRALFGARGDLFTVPAEKGNIRNLTKTSGVHERNSVWSPDGKWIAYVSDKTGNDEIWLTNPEGTEQVQITNDAQSYRFELKWAPDSKKILCSDKAMRLYYVDIDSKKTTEITQSKTWEIRDFSWSPDSKWIAYTDAHPENEASVVYIYSLANGKINQVSDEFFDSGEPVFSQNGKYLFFTSNRTFNPNMGNFEMSYVYNSMTTIFGVTLQDTVQSPFKFESDEAKPESDKPDEKADADKSKTDTKKSTKETVADVKIDFAGIKDRIFEMPGPAGYYNHLVSIKNKLYYVTNSAGKPALMAYDFDDKKETKIGDFSGFEISANCKKILISKDGNYYITDLKEGIKLPDKALDLSDMKVSLNPKEEWKQIFDECWRQMRDFFYAPNMHGVDWKAMHDRYAELLPYVVHRSDLTYIMGEMIAELNCGHLYVGGGEMPHADKVPIGLLGARFELDKSSGFYKITKIYPGRNWAEETRSPLTEPGIDVKEGDYLIAVDGVKLSAEIQPLQALINKANKFVTLKFNSKPSESGAKEYTVKTISREAGLIYYDWVETNRKKVEKATNGEVGYIHIPNMGLDGLNEFVKYFYPQTRKKALIVDDRYNGGGFVSNMIIERLRRVMTMVGIARNQQHAEPYPDAVFSGPMVCLVNELSMSDGDMFPYQFKTAGLGKIIGRRTWGGVVGIRGTLPLLDGGYLMRPEFSHAGTSGDWILEGVGMVPDIDVQNDPALEQQGIDQQLDKALEVIREEMKKDIKPKIPAIKPFPDKSK
ncbi:MAG: PDZ domain-containing protein, partial [Bacteroidota bacterium]